jgi:predicted ATPase
MKIPATRLSDGTLRYLCLIAILCHPELPPLVCIEEPELGLHPDALVVIARMLQAASERSQIVVTTHSKIIVDALSDTPEYVVVCDKVEGQTRMKRLDGKELKVWLEKYSLGELWRSGEIGGNRW